MRIVFFGAVEFSRYCLKALLAERANVVGVFSPDRLAAANNSDYADLGPLAAASGVPCYRFQRVRDPETIECIRSLRPDVIFVLGLSQLLPADVLSMPRLGCIGSHPALLPRNRGRHPLIWALVENLTESGLTFLYLDEGADSGDILWQRAFPITPDDDATTLYGKMTALATIGLKECLPQLEAGRAPRTPQDHSVATYWRKRTEADGEIDWRQPATKVHRLVRALTHPYAGSHSYADGGVVKIWRTRLMPNGAAAPDAPGTVLARTDNGRLIQCGDASIEVLAWECMNGSDLTPRMTLGPRS